MSIVVGSDFSEASNHAVAAAAQLARRLKLPLHLVHAIELGQAQAFAEPPAAYAKWAADMLQRQAETLRQADISVDTHVRSTPTDDALFDVAQQVDARLIVVAASQSGERRSLGSRADRIAAHSHVPVLAIRDPRPFEAWTREERPLRVVLAADLSLSAEAAMRWLNDLTSVGPCDILLVHLYWPPQQFQRLGLSGVRSLIEPDSDVTRTLRHDFDTRLGAYPGLQNVKFRLEPNLGRFDARIAAIAAEHNADLVVVGAHGKNVTERIWEGSVSRGVLRLAASSVVCVPLAASAAPARAKRISSILVATDFSDVGNSAVQLAYSIAPAGAWVHLVHVIPSASDGFEPHDIFEPGKALAPESAAAETRLRALIPGHTDDGQARTVVHVLGARSAAAAIAQAAERLDVDLLCLGTRGRSGVARTLLGSQAQTVLASTHRPVLFARAPIA